MIDKDQDKNSPFINNKNNKHMSEKSILIKKSSSQILSRHYRITKLKIHNRKKKLALKNSFCVLF